VREALVIESVVQIVALHEDAMPTCGGFLANMMESDAKAAVPEIAVAGATTGATTDATKMPRGCEPGIGNCAGKFRFMGRTP